LPGPSPRDPNAGAHSGLVNAEQRYARKYRAHDTGAAKINLTLESAAGGPMGITSCGPW